MMLMVELKKAMAEKTTEKIIENKFTKHALLKSVLFSQAEKDILSVVLPDHQEFTLNDAKDRIKNFKEGI